MRIFHGFDNLPKFCNPAATIGSFDGLHRGHMMLLGRVIQQAKKDGGESVVLTFDPHPRVVLKTDLNVRLLTTLKEKEYLLELLGIDNLIVIPFDTSLSQMSPADFARNYLIAKVGIKSLILGYDNHFGRNKEGGHNFLKDNNFGFKVIEIEEINIEKNQNLSSTAIRELVLAGEMKQVALMLSHPYIVCGRNNDGVVSVDDIKKLLPPCGVYDVDINGESSTLTITNDNRLIIDSIVPNGDVIIYF